MRFTDQSLPPSTWEASRRRQGALTDAADAALRASPWAVLCSQCSVNEVPREPDTSSTDWLEGGPMDECPKSGREQSTSLSATDVP